MMLGLSQVRKSRCKSLLVTLSRCTNRRDGDEDSWYSHRKGKWGKPSRGSFFMLRFERRSCSREFYAFLQSNCCHPSPSGASDLLCGSPRLWPLSSPRIIRRAQAPVRIDLKHREANLPRAAQRLHSR